MYENSARWHSCTILVRARMAVDRIFLGFPMAVHAVSHCVKLNICLLCEQIVNGWNLCSPDLWEWGRLGEGLFMKHLEGKVLENELLYGDVFTIVKPMPRKSR